MGSLDVHRGPRSEPAEDHGQGECVEDHGVSAQRAACEISAERATGGKGGEGRKTLGHHTTIHRGS